MELVHTISSNFERGKENFIQRMKYLFENGVTSFRVNMKSFSDDEFIRINRMLTELRGFSNDISFRFVIYLDLPYPNGKYRGRCGNNIRIEKNNILLLAKESDKCNLPNNKYITVFLDDDFFSNENLKTKNIIYGDGLGVLSIEKICDCGVYVKARNEFILFDKKSFNANIIKRSVINSNLIEKLLKLCTNHSIDYIMLSFCDKAIDIKAFKEKLSLLNVEFLAKIETAISTEALNEIAEESEGLVVARGDLGLNIPHNNFLFYQSLISQVAKEKNKKLYFATGILDSLLSLPFPSRGDITDFANIICNKPNGLIFNSKIGNKKRIEVLNEYIRFQNLF